MDIAVAGSVVRRDAAMLFRTAGACAAFFAAIGGAIVFLGVISGVSFPGIPLISHLNRHPAVSLQAPGVLPGATAQSEPAAEDVAPAARSSAVSSVATDGPERTAPVRSRRPAPVVVDDPAAPAPDATAPTRGELPCSDCGVVDSLVRTLFGPPDPQPSSEPTTPPSDGGVVGQITSLVPGL